MLRHRFRLNLLASSRSFRWVCGLAISCRPRVTTRRPRGPDRNALICCAIDVMSCLNSVVVCPQCGARPGRLSEANLRGPAGGAGWHLSSLAVWYVARPRRRVRG